MWQAFPASDYYGNSASLPSIGATFPWHLDRPSPVHMPDSNALVRLPVAVFALACRKSMQASRSSYALSEDSLPAALHVRQAFGGGAYLSPPQPACHLISRVGGGDISAHRRG